MQTINSFNIYLAGVGGQGIGLLSEVILRAADHAGQPVKGVDTHGLAQRGGIVASQIRMGQGVYSPMIPAHRADLVVALECHEALRAVMRHAKSGGHLIYYNTVWQPLEVRLGQASQVSTADIQAQCRHDNISFNEVFEPGLEDARMQNAVVLAHIARAKLIPRVDAHHYLEAMADLMSGDMLEKNKTLFQRLYAMPLT